MNAAELPTLAAATQMTVVIPARDEAVLLPHALTALDNQCDLAGGPLPRGSYDIVVLANGCRDATADAARRHAARRDGPRISVIEASFAPHEAHVGMARRTVMDLAAARFHAAGRTHGIVASTDADTRVDPQWIAATLAAMRYADAVTGDIAISPSERAALPAVLRELYDDETAYQRLRAELLALRDPIVHDPFPRHAHHYGASFAVSAAAYTRAGGVPVRAYLEDLAFFEALEAIDARVRHAPDVRVVTSARLATRVDGGFGTFLRDLNDRGTLWVESPATTLARIDARAALRRLWHTRTAATLARVSGAYALDTTAVRTAFAAHEPFGANAQRFDALAAPGWNAQPRVPVAAAIAALRAVREALTAARPTRSVIASVAG